MPQRPGAPLDLARALARPLRFRPLLWMALCALSGVALGGAWAVYLGAPDGLTRADARLLWPLLPAFVALAAAIYARRNGLWWRVCFALFLVFGFAAHAARRIAPPEGDVSLLSRLPARADAPNGPIEAPIVRVRGLVADYPKRAEFNTQFPLECLAPHAGRIWVRADFDAPVKAGDLVTLNLALKPIMAPTNMGERAQFWSSVGQNCWCEGRVQKGILGKRAAVAFPLARAVEGWRSAILSRYENTFGGANGLPDAARPFPGACAQLLTAMVFGEGGLSRPLPRSLKDDFRAAGLSHVLVASGTQVTFIAAALILGLQTLGARRVWLVLGVLPGLLFYAVLAGAAPSIWRATAGGILVAIALGSGREVDGLSLWGAALGALLLLDPALAWSLSLQLTFAAVWGLMCLAPLIERVLRRVARGYLVQLAALSLGAQWATLPISLFHFGTFSLAGLGANFLAVPLAGVLVFTGALGLAFPFLGALNYWETRGIEAIAHGFASMPGAGVQGASFKIVWVIGCYALFLAAMTANFDEPNLGGRIKLWLHERWRNAKRREPWPFLVGAVLAGAALSYWRFAPAPQTLRMVMLDVGQGQAVVIISPRGRAILVDGGSSDGRADVGQSVIVPALQALGVERLEAIFLSDSDPGKCNGLPAVLREVPTALLVDGAVTGANSHPPTALEALAPDPSDVDYLALRRLAKVLKVPVSVPTAGQNFDFDGVSVRVLSPSAPPLQSGNDNSLALRLKWGENAIVLGGDLEGAGESRVVRRGGELGATVLCVARHGASSSSGEEFLRATKPAIALISVGRYNFDKLPAASTVRRLSDAGAATFRTDLDGALTVECDRQKCAVSAARQAGQ